MESEKVSIVEQDKQGRFVGWLAGAVALLAVAFIVFIACGTVVLQNKQACDVTTTPVKHEETLTKNVDTKHDGTATHQRITLYTESHVELVVNRNKETGHVESVITIDYDKKTTTLYRAADNRCYMLKGYKFGKFDDALNKLDKIPESNSEAEELKLSFMIGDRVKNTTEISVQMTAFCATHNTYYLEEVDPDEADSHRGKRQTYVCLVEIVYLGKVFTKGRWFHVWLHVHYRDWSADCLSPDTPLLNMYHYAYV